MVATLRVPLSLVAMIEDNQSLLTRLNQRRCLSFHVLKTGIFFTLAYKKILRMLGLISFVVETSIQHVRYQDKDG
jgi:hypothetical protein